jgi:steroid delta-isomerase-like uncharacterized protein
MSPQATAVSPQARIEAAKTMIIAYNDKNWERAKAAITPDFLYDEVATGRKIEGADETLAAWKGWAQAFPDSKASFDRSYVAGDDTVVLELTWRGTHQGPLGTAMGNIAATGRSIEVRALAIVELKGEKARSQRQFFDMATLLQQIGLKWSATGPGSAA